MNNFTWNLENPLSRSSGETRKANDALTAYYGLGYNRSMPKLYRQYTESVPHLTTLKNWSVKYQWQARINAQAEIDNAADRAFWARQRQQIRQDDLKAATALRERAERMRSFPIAEQQTTESYPDGREKIIIIKPAKWREADISRIETTASDLARRAADMQKENIGINITEVDYSTLTDEQLDRIAKGESVARVITARTSAGRTGTSKT